MPREYMHTKLGSVGKPLPHNQIRVGDDQGADVPTGSIGEVLIRGPKVFSGYWRDPEATEKAFVDGWFRTGDLGRLDQDGFLYIEDRKKDMIVSGGENIYPAEVENVLAKHPAVADVAVIGVPDAKWGEAVKAVVVPGQGTEVTAQELITFAREHLAGFKLPKSVDFTEVLPRNPSGKLLKREIRAPYWVGAERQIG
jgi:long-chain acyl-CoA synthetase